MSFGISRFYHVTEAENVASILTDGFRPDWGDDGFGVYLFNNPFSAGIYAAKGGWDGALKDPVILYVDCPNEVAETIIPNPEWPNPDDYLSILIYRVDEDLDPNDPAIWWKPERGRFGNTI